MKKIDNSDGSKVEIMICDIRSYEYAMYYMLQFNDKNNMILFWDEPTIFLDYKTHENHHYIHNVWSKNKIQKIILSSATLPKIDELNNLVNDFLEKFCDNNPIIETINSHDCKKTIPLLDNNYYTYLPHHVCDNYIELKNSIEFCNSNLTLLRYFDLHEISLISVK